MTVSTTEPIVNLDQRVLDVAEGMGLLDNGSGQIPRLLAALCNPDTDSRQIISLLKMEPALCLRVLRIANSAFYRRTGEIGTISHAVTALGLDAVRGIAAAGCLNRAMLACTGRGPIPIAPLLRHSLATAVLCEALASKAGVPAGEALVAGLMHHLGVAIQMCVDRDGATRMARQRAHGDTRPITELESECTLVSHTHCFAVVATHWQLPSQLIESVRYHHDPLNAPAAATRTSASLLALGSQLAVTSGYTYALEPAGEPPNPDLIGSMNIKEHYLQHVCENLAERIDGLDTALQGG